MATSNIVTLIEENSMSSVILLDGDHIRILGHAINCILNMQHNFGDSAVTVSRDEDEQVLRVLFNELVAQQRFHGFTNRKIVISIDNNFLCKDGEMNLPNHYLRLMIQSADYLCSLFQESPDELEILTGSNLLKACNLLEAMQAVISQDGGTTSRVEE